jgi:NAD(P)-dependent dehydrogenase (short-subunit alcohol dehydrogenase family)
MDLGIKGKVALVVGCSRGMGFAVAKELTDAGCKVVGVSRNAGDYRLDITDQPRLNDFIDSMHREHGAPDIIVHVTGGSAGLRDHMQPWSAWEKVMQLNLGAAHEINRAFLPIMVSRGWGRIVHTSSNGVKLGTGRAPYVAAKHAVEGYVQIMPGLFIYEQDEAWTKAFMEKYVPMGRWGKDEEVAAAVALLCSDRAGYMAGAVLDVDGSMR